MSSKKIKNKGSEENCYAETPSCHIPTPFPITTHNMLLAHDPNFLHLPPIFLL